MPLIAWIAVATRERMVDSFMVDIRNAYILSYEIVWVGWKSLSWENLPFSYPLPQLAPVHSNRSGTSIV
jgi:hypothetical protein